MKEIEYSIILKEEVDAFELKLINLYWEVYYDHHSQRFKPYKTIAEILISLNLKENFPLDDIVIQKSSLIIFSPQFSCSLCNKPLSISSRDFYYQFKNICELCKINNTNLIIKDLFDKVETYNNKIKKKLNLVMDELNYLEKLYVLAIYDNISLDDFGKLESEGCRNFWNENFCQNNHFFEELFDKDILIEIDEELFNYPRLLNEINAIDFEKVDEELVRYLKYLWLQKLKFGIYLNYPNEFYSHDVWVNTIRSYLEFNGLANNDMENLIDFFKYIRYRESLVVINSFLSKENLEINKDNKFYYALDFFMEKNSLFDLIFLLEYDLELEVENFKQEQFKIKNKFIKFNISEYLLEYKNIKYNYSIDIPVYLNKCYFSKYFEDTFIHNNKNWFECTLEDIKKYIKSNVKM